MYKTVFSLTLCLISTMVAIQSHAGVIVNEAGYTTSFVTSVPGSTGAYGNIVEGADGTLYFTTPSNNYGIFARKNGVNVQITSNLGTELSLTMNGENLLIGNAQGRIYNYDTNTRALRYMGYVGSQALSLSMTPAGFGPHGGKLAVGTTNGLRVFDLNTGSFSSVNGVPYVNGVQFASDGTLYMGDRDGRIFEAFPSGSVSLLKDLPGSGGNIAIHKPTGDIYVAQENTTAILKIDAVTATVSTFATGIQWDGGYWPSALSFSNDGTSLFFSERPANNPDPNFGGIFRIDGFEGFDEQNTVPEPTSLALFGIGALGLVFRRRRRSE